jgi:hypothetical protein
MTAPARVYLRQLDTHRLIPSKYGEDDTGTLGLIADDDEHLRAILDLDGATDDRRAGEDDRLPGIDRGELVFGVPHDRIVNAAFLFAHPLGGRFNGPDRGAWYAGFASETARAEVAWHKSVELAEIGWFEETLTYDAYLADFGGPFHDIRDDPAFRGCLDPDDYRPSQDLAEALLAGGSAGIVYPSVRHRGGTCLACFRPAMVGNVRRHARWRFLWRGSPEPAVELDQIFD